MFFNTAAIFSLLLIVNLTAGYSNGSGSCVGGKAAVGGNHLTQPSTQGGTLASIGAKVSIGNIELSTTAATDVPVGSDLTLTVDLTGGAYTGLMVRLQAPAGTSTTAALNAGTNTKLATDVCVAPVVGISHTSSSSKSSSSGTVRFDQAVNGVILDVTVVVENNNSKSRYAYSSYTVNFKTLSSPTIPAPTNPAPTNPAPTKPSPTKPAPTKPTKPWKPWKPWKPAPTKPTPSHHDDDSADENEHEHSHDD
jgi:hypothetical protein